MATAESAGKTCVVCGKDVTGQPRVKDAAGKYMCAGECQQKAIAAAKARKDAQAGGQSAASVPKAPLPAGGLLGQLIDDSPMLKAAKCESCGSAMPGGSVICTRCGFNTQTGKALKTAVIVEKEKKEEKIASRYKREFGPSFGVLFLIVAGSIGLLCGLTVVSPIFMALGFLLGGACVVVGAVWGIVDAFRQGEALWGVLGVLGFILGFPGLGFLYYMIFVNELKWSKSLYLGAIVGLITGFVIAIATVQGGFDAVTSGNFGP